MISNNDPPKILSLDFHLATNERLNQHADVQIFNFFEKSAPPSQHA
jgi:hypothetical protein